MGWPSPLGVGVWPFLIEVGLLAHSSGGNWSCLFVVGGLALPFLGCEFLPSLLGSSLLVFWVGPCPSFSRCCRPLPSCCGGSPSLLGVVVWPFLHGDGFGPRELALPCCGGGSPCLLRVGAWPFWDLVLGVKVVPAFSEWVGLRLSGLVFGPSLSRWGCWPCLLGVGLACHSSGGNWSCLFGVVLALPSNAPSFSRW